MDPGGCWTGVLSHRRLAPGGSLGADLSLAPSSVHSLEPQGTAMTAVHKGPATRSGQGRGDGQLCSSQVQAALKMAELGEGRETLGSPGKLEPSLNAPAPAIRGPRGGRRAAGSGAESGGGLGAGHQPSHCSNWKRRIALALQRRGCGPHQHLRPRVPNRPPPGRR